MVAKKGKRKIEYEGNIFYWFVRADDNGRLRIHILSEDKKINLEYPPFDSEVPVTPSYIRRLLDNYFMKSIRRDSYTKGESYELQYYFSYSV